MELGVLCLMITIPLWRVSLFVDFCDCIRFMATSGIVSESCSVPVRSALACKKCAGQPEIYRFLGNPH